MEFTPLSQEQRQAFERDGYLVIPDALAPDMVERLLKVADRLYREGEAQEGLNDRGFWQKRNCLPCDDLFLELLDWPTTVPLVAQLLGHNIQLITSHLVVRPPSERGAGAADLTNGWHRDGGTAPSDLGTALPRLFIKVGYCLTDLSERGRGAIRLIPGSNNLTTPPAGIDDGGDPKNAVELQVRSGAVILFENRTYHAVGTNFSEIARKSIFFGYGYRWIRPMDYFSMPADLLERCDPIRRQLLGDRTSPMGFQLPESEEVPLRSWLEEHGEAVRSFRDEMPGLYSRQKE
jgi:ectoine hydroxylase-related dioxygenase (phytanoyl-CoA dioxygenase family)